MPFLEVYNKQVALLIRSLSYVAEEESFALKGGSAINLFVRDMPRLSVDIDLTYVPVAPRDESLTEIDAAMKRIAQRVRDGIPDSSVSESSLRNEAVVCKLFIREGGVQIKIEVTDVLRGCVFGPEMASVSPAVENAYGFAEINTVSFADLYGGKIIAALDRQHPRDLFDIHYLLENEGIDEHLRGALIVYLISHNRPMHEVLAPKHKDIEDEYKRGFVGMTAEPVALSLLIDARERLIDTVTQQMPPKHRRFLLSFERGKPEWGLLDIKGADQLPAVLWRQQNLNGLADDRRLRLVAALQDILSESSP